ncbi:MAG: sugar phosphate isomerase/epimerase [Chloroflexota bacterium]|nr:sugar phosphate isomerase/epimerase [Chloroflexota bacterium]
MDDQRAGASGPPDDGRGAPRVATAPVNWNNVDLAGTVAEVPYPDLLDEMAAAGYDATELGGNFPIDPATLHHDLLTRGMRLCGAFHSLPLIDDDRMRSRRPALTGLLKLLAGAGSTDVNFAIEATPERIALAGHVPADGGAGLSAAEWARAGRNLAEAGEMAAEHGLRAHFHNHVGTFVETPGEVERLIAELSGDHVDICFDGGHYAYGGGDPIAFVERHRDRIGYVHLKDVDPVVLRDARARELSFLDALREFVFCELGQGMVDIPGMVHSLRAGGYTGWLVVEQDTTPRDPTVSARANRAFLRERCGL